MGDEAWGHADRAPHLLALVAEAKVTTRLGLPGQVGLAEPGLGQLRQTQDRGG